MKAFEKFSAGALELKNRIVMPPMVVSMADTEGCVTDKQLEHYRKRAEGGAGLIIVEATSVSEERMLFRNGGLGIWARYQVSGLKRLVATIKSAGACSAIQLADSLVDNGLSVVDIDASYVRKIIRDFTEAALRAQEAGFDAVEIHGAHRYTVADFLSARTNRRNDEYGGDTRGRTRLAAEIVGDIKYRLGSEFPVMFRFSADEFQNHGNTLKDGIEIAGIMEKSGVDILHVTAGGRAEEGLSSYSRARAIPDHRFLDGANLHVAEAVKRAVSKPVIAVGKIHLPEMVEEILGRDIADLVAIGRQLLADPFFPLKMKEGRWSDINHCTYCNLCLEDIYKKVPAKCHVYS